MVPVRIRRVLMARHRVDFRKQLNGLLAEAYRVGGNPYAGDCVVFVKNDFTQLRAIVGDEVGLYMISRRFEGGRLHPLTEFAQDPSVKSISTAELSLLLEGASFSVQRRVRTRASEHEKFHADARISAQPS